MQLAKCEYYVIVSGRTQFGSYFRATTGCLSRAITLANHKITAFTVKNGLRAKTQRGPSLTVIVQYVHSTNDGIDPDILNADVEALCINGP